MLKARWTMLAGRIGKAPWGVADQAMMSACNLAVTVLLARSLTQADFGVFALSFAVLLLANTIQQGLITLPHNILGPALRGEAYRRYTASTALSQLVFSLTAATGVLSASAAAAQWGASDEAMLLLVLAPTLVAWQTQEFIRRVLYTEGRLSAAFANDAVAYGGQAAGVVALWWLDRLTPAAALAAIAVSNAAGVMVGGWLLHGSVAWNAVWSGTWTDRCEAWRENWRVGKWLAGSGLAGTWLCDGTLLFIAAAVLGPAAAGVIEGVHRLFGPIRILAQSLQIMLPIRLARTLSSRGDGALRAETRLALVVAAPAFAVFCVVLVIFAAPILRLVYGEPWGQEAGILRLYALATLTGYLAAIFGAALKARQATRSVFFNRITAGLIGLPLGCVLIWLIGLPGAVWGMVASAVILTILNYLAYQRVRTTPTPSTTTTAPGGAAINELRGVAT